MKYRVILEYLTVNIISDNVNWQDRNITLSRYIEYIPINIKHYQTVNITLPDLITSNPALTYLDIINYTQQNNIYTQPNSNIAPLYIISDILVLGIISFYDKLDDDYKLFKTMKCYENYVLLAHIEAGISKINIFRCIINNVTNKTILCNKYLHLETEFIDILWENIFKNIMNYLPMFDIIYKKACNTNQIFYDMQIQKLSNDVTNILLTPIGDQ